jgi:cytochrome c oxidase subunit 2
VRTAQILLAIATLGGFDGLASHSQAFAPETQQVHEIAVTAKKYEFSPNPIRVAKGEHVRLVITAVDHDHGFKLDAFGITQSIKKGASATIEFTADKAGTFPFRCSVFCGLGHAGMKGALIVE